MLTSTIVIGSQTNTMRAQKCLTNGRIRCEVVKINSEKSSGCIYGLKIPSDDMRRAMQLLDGCNIKYQH